MEFGERAGYGETKARALVALRELGLDLLEGLAELVQGVIGNADAFSIGTAATSALYRVIYDQASGALYYDADGTGSLAQIQFAKPRVGLALTAGNFGLYTL